MSEKIIAKNLLDAEAVFLRPSSPFTWASGIKSPIYCDNRLLLSYPKERSLIVEGFISLVKENFPEVEMLMGTATAGIPWAALVAQSLQKPMGYVRSSFKNHGQENKIEGRIKKGMKVVVVEDLISTGGSVKKVIESLRSNGCEVLGVVAIFTYLLPQASQTFKTLDCPLKTLSNYDALLEVAVAGNYIQATDLNKLKAFQADVTNNAWLKE